MEIKELKDFCTRRLSRDLAVADFQFAQQS